MKQIKNSVLLVLLVILTTLGLMAQEAAYNVVVNKDNPVNSLTKKEVSNLFLKKVTKWSNGRTVQPLDLVETSRVRDKFSKEIHSRKVSSIKAYWQKQIFSGRKIPPAEKKSDREVLTFVQKNPGAIGYISSANKGVPANIKIVKVN